MKSFFVTSVLATILPLYSQPLELRVYGPGGPGPAVKACATAFTKKTGIRVIVESSSPENWINRSKDADLFFSGAEYMMDNFVLKIPHIDAKSIETLYLRPSALLVRPQNPRKIHGIRSLIGRDIKVMVVNGAGQIGMWEDILGGLKTVSALNQFRKQIVYPAPTSADAQKRWLEDPTIDAWLAFNVWGAIIASHADVIPTEKDLTIYRSMGTALVKQGKNQKAAKGFIDFMKSAEGRKLFEKEGWF